MDQRNSVETLPTCMELYIYHIFFFFNLLFSFIYIKIVITFINCINFINYFGYEFLSIGGKSFNTDPLVSQ